MNNCWSRITCFPSSRKRNSLAQCSRFSGFTYSSTAVNWSCFVQEILIKIYLQRSAIFFWDKWILLWWPSEVASGNSKQWNAGNIVKFKIISIQLTLLFKKKPIMIHSFINLLGILSVFVPFFFVFFLGSDFLNNETGNKHLTNIYLVGSLWEDCPFYYLDTCGGRVYDL